MRAHQSYSLPWPPVFDEFVNSLRFFMFDLAKVTKLECAQPMAFDVQYGYFVVGSARRAAVCLVRADLMCHNRV